MSRAPYTYIDMLVLWEQIAWGLHVSERVRTGTAHLYYIHLPSNYADL